METIPKMLLMAALALSASVVMPSTYAAELPPAAARSPIVVYPQLATRSAGANVSSALLERLRELRILRVLVGLDLKHTPSHRLSEAQSSRQRAELETMQKNRKARKLPKQKKKKKNRKLKQKKKQPNLDQKNAMLRFQSARPAYRPALLHYGRGQSMAARVLRPRLAGDQRVAYPN